MVSDLIGFDMVVFVLPYLQTTNYVALRYVFITTIDLDNIGPEGVYVAKCHMDKEFTGHGWPGIPHTNGQKF